MSGAATTTSPKQFVVWKIFMFSPLNSRVGECAVIACHLRISKCVREVCEVLKSAFFDGVFTMFT